MGGDENEWFKSGICDHVTSALSQDMDGGIPITDRTLTLTRINLSLDILFQVLTQVTL